MPKDIKAKNGKPVANPGIERKTKRVHVAKLKLNANRQMEGVILSDGSELVGIVGGGMQKDGAKDETSGEFVDVLQLAIVGKFELEQPPQIHTVKRSPILGPDGRPL